MKKILVIHYSQSGQLTEILDRFTKPLRDSNEINIVYHRIEMIQDFPFPWDSESFFNAFPETFLQIPQEIRLIPDEILEQDFDLIVLGYQVWYLSPSIPINSFLKSERAKKLLNNKPIVTISGNRNMWAMAQQKIKTLIQNNNGNLVGNVALVDKHQNHISVLTILHWMFTGKKTRYLGFFPKPGVSQKDIFEADKFGEILKPYLLKNDYNNLQNELVLNKAVDINHFLISADQKANKLFSIWANWIYKSKNRKVLLKLFSVYLWIAIWFIMPIVFVFYIILYPLKINKIKRELKRYKGI